MVKIYLDPGHGGNDPGAVGNGLQEKNVTLDIAKKIRDILNNEYQGHSIRMSRTTDKSLSLSQRTNDANNWGADIFLSIHINAGGGVGYEDFIFNGGVSNNTVTYQNVLHDEIMKQVDFRDRGKKKANFHVLRESRMPAVLTENGFIDNSGDAAKLKSNAYLNRIARGHANGIVKAFNLKKKSSGGGSNEYVEIITHSLWTYNSADWDDKAVTVSKGEVFTIIRDKFKVGGGHMYQIKSGLYITANPKYVRYYKK
ncbi:N-acetylmuramoyl-L-alanine amidase [Oceanobacillus kimchii]|uniref:N-acetylmuramoyl-L-alanine amidase n=1 Tax=Oceanobacillus kimchii TaxID=746691 RepID=UPI0021A2A8DB|nr:N-acetylmuramoyl-L-alanine amidase [Oceanobacillus kimchii]MCT1577523.1 N-acetylmuramoyl-L-alanine amidase [Oceanobacillus kimchii]MCT2137131.1 N-acetylmuramoyl-L-alanine amidase [Oceanobacillus kimchii]